MVAGEGAEADAPDGAAVRPDAVDLGARQPPPAADRVQRHAAVVVRRRRDPRARVVVEAHVEVRLVLVFRKGEEGEVRVVADVGASTGAGLRPVFMVRPSITKIAITPGVSVVMAITLSEPQVVDG